MVFTRKFDRAFQWAGEKMGSESRTSMPDEFRMLETEMALRHDGMDKLQKSMNAYVKWLSRREEILEDKDKGNATTYLARTMTTHGEDFEPESEFGNCLVSMGRANERIGHLQENFAADATSTWLESLERSLAMMKEYQSARKKLENRRLAYDSTISKMQKARRDDFRLEDELRTCKAKYEESSEDVTRRMQDIKDAEADSVRDLTGFLDAELDYHERCTEELRAIRQNWAVGASSGSYSSERRPTGRSRANTARSFGARSTRDIYEEAEPESMPVRMPIRATSRPGVHHTSSFHAEVSTPTPRPAPQRTSTFQGPTTLDRRVSTNASPPHGGTDMGVLRGQLRPVNRISTAGQQQLQQQRDDVFADDHDDSGSAYSGGGSPEWSARSASPATSYGSLNRSTSTLGRKAAPPPPPPSRSKKPPPPVPAKREFAY